MNNGLKIRKRIFEALLDEDEKSDEKKENRKNWEKLCCSEKPLVPFVGAGMSAWCYPTWENLLRSIVSKYYPEKCMDIVEKALEYNRKGIKIGLKKGKQTQERTEEQIKEQTEEIYWMEEIAECIFEENRESIEKDDIVVEIKEESIKKDEEVKELLLMLWRYIGKSDIDKKLSSKNELYKIFDIERLNEKEKMPEYQNYFHHLFKDILITTNYDMALEKCYPSIFSYSHKDLEGNNKENSWLYKAVTAKIDNMQRKMDGKAAKPVDITVPEIPMLLKVHGSIEQAQNMALSRDGYNKAYKGKMPELLKKIFKETTVIFLGYSLGKDRIMNVLKKAKKEEPKICHFAFLPESWKKRNDAENLKEYGVYPIFYSPDILPLELFRDEDERNAVYHDYCLGLLMENLVRRKMYYPRQLELLWDDGKYEGKNASDLVEDSMKKMIKRQNFQYVRRKKAMQIWKMLNYSEECPLIAVTGKQGSGRSTFCKSIIELQEGSKDTMQFFYISLLYCKSWEEYCIQIFQVLNIIQPDIPEQDRWKEVAELVNERCSGYWKSVLILDHMDSLRNIKEFPQLWETIKKMLRYWKSHQTRVMIICQEYPEDIPCHVWHMGKLNNKDSRKVFFSSCISGRYRELTYLEKKVVNELVRGQKFRASTIELLGIYANSKSDLSSLLEEWKLYHLTGDSGEQTVTRILWNHLLDEHRYEEKEGDKQEQIKKNILWLWGILGNYPGMFPSEFLKIYLNETSQSGYKEKGLSQRTLMYMKNIGLCEETEELNQNQLLQNMICCVQKYFLEGLKNIKSEYDELDSEFRKKAGMDYENAELPCGLRNFKGYIMHAHQSDLRKYVLQEEKCKILQGDCEKDILNILKLVSEKVKNNEMRKEYKELNLVMHYEIKTVIRFLSGYFLRADSKKRQTSQREQISVVLEIGYNFSHYYHYAPQHAYHLVKRLLQYMEENGEELLYRQAKLNRVMGDIQRLLGHKKDAAYCYDEAVRLCDKYMVEALGEREAYRECVRIKAGALLMKYDHIVSAESNDIALEEVLKLYRMIGDEWGIAYYNQRRGEMLLNEVKEKMEMREQEKKFNEICEKFNIAASSYFRNENQTGLAYILKCMGDLLTKCHGVYDGEEGVKGTYFIVVKEEPQKGRYYQVKKDHERTENKSIIKRDLGWMYAASKCYLESFYCYYSHINWRGFANVIQGMGTCYRTKGTSNWNKDFIKNVEELYGLAEECYRWLGDVRGLADTLEYFGYGYEEAYECTDMQKEEYYYMAMSKWTESKSIWKDLDIKEKIVSIENAKNKLQEVRDGKGEQRE